ncbi:MAG: Phosphopentomutase [Firmicutes bacterium ADurb.Bin182]|nr:MAG: Phosphopentomutase [Firmicutes bacterium ADurb.Bin182]
MDNRVILIVLDSVGIGAMPDASEFGDEGAHTLGNIYAKRKKLDLPNMYGLGLAHIDGSRLPKHEGAIRGSFGKASEMTKAKDTTSGHWELAGYIMDEPFKTFPAGFPEELIREYENRIGIKILGNIAASGTEIINVLGDEHVKTGRPIVYTSADSVFQIAAHEQVIPLKELYRICETAREILVGKYLVGRVIARPFTGSNGKYQRTENRRDYATAPAKDTILDGLQSLGFKTVGIGKIEDIFAHRGIYAADHTKNNHDGIEVTIKYIASGGFSLIFTNLVDFDMLYGHRNDVESYAKALEYFDERLPEIISGMRPDDLLIITADHGCDPTFKGTDHTREFVPVLVYSKRLKPGIDLGTLDSFADIGSTVYEYITGKTWGTGTSFLSKLKNA